MSKPSIPQGTRDFSPSEVRRRQYIFSTLRGIFERYGFEPIETPAMENLVTLTGKYGEEGDRLIFKVLNNGLHAQDDAQKAKMTGEWNRMLEKSYSTPVITERALRYDLTIPFARYMVMHQADTPLPFRRYQMQPVWRADRPQKGRYREFWQCDADVIGSTSLVNEAELLCIYTEAFRSLQVPVKIRINSRKVLAGLAEICGVPDKLTELTIALDKLDKIGWDGVMTELQQRNIPVEQVHRISEILSNTASGNYYSRLEVLRGFFAGSEVGLQGLEEISKTLHYFHSLNGRDEIHSHLEVDITLARGLNYYTGVIVEVVCDSDKVKMGSIGGGGRYDDLTGLFGLKGVSGVGVSFGIDRIYDVIEELGVFPADVARTASVLVANFGGPEESYALHVVQALRAAGICAQVYPDASKFDKQIKFANRKGFTYFVLTGSDERLQNKVSLKNLISGSQDLLSVPEAIAAIKG
jgi:histidyl-tRNA synthetase